MKIKITSILLKEIADKINSELAIQRLFHLSDQNIERFKAIPRVPGYLTKYPEYTKLENGTIPRFCVAPSISNCLTAMNIAGKVGTGIDGKGKGEAEELIFWVYEPESYDSLKIKSNSDIVREKLVYDAQINGETWILNECIMKNTGTKLRVLKAIEQIKYTWVVDGKKKHYVNYKYSYEILEGDQTLKEYDRI
jgi:hypothetical protein